MDRGWPLWIAHGRGRPTGPGGGTHRACGSNILTLRYHQYRVTHAGSYLRTCVRFLSQLYSRQLRVSSCEREWNGFSTLTQCPIRPFFILQPLLSLISRFALFSSSWPKRDHIESSIRDSKPVMTFSSDGVKGCLDQRFRPPPGQHCQIASTQSQQPL